MSAPLHICIVGPAEPAELREHLCTEDLIPQGIGGVLVNELAKEYVRRGFFVTLVTHSPSVSTVWRARGPSLAVSVVPSRSRARDRALDFFAVERRGIAAELRGIHPDVVHAHWTYEFALGAFGARVAPVLVTAHDLPWTVFRSFRDPYRFIRWMMALRARCSIRHLTAVSPYTAAGWRREMKYRRPIALIPNPIPVMPKSALKRSVHPVVLSVGDASPRKNLKSLIVAFDAVRSAAPEAELRLVGPGLDSVGELSDWARAVGLDERVSFIGPLDRRALADAYAEATVYCHPSTEETFGMVLVEALSAGLPVVAGARSGGVAWTLFDGQAGRLVEDVRDPSQLARALLDAIRDPLSTVAQGFDVQAALHARYSLESVAKQYLSAYRDLAFGSRDGSNK